MVVFTFVLYHLFTRKQILQYTLFISKMKRSWKDWVFLGRSSPISDYIRLRVTLCVWVNRVGLNYLHFLSLLLRISYYFYSPILNRMPIAVWLICMSMRMSMLFFINLYLFLSIDGKMLFKDLWNFRKESLAFLVFDQLPIVMRYQNQK